MHCSRGLLILGLSLVLLTEIQWTLAKPTQSVDQALAHIPKHPFSATMCAAILKFDCSHHKVTDDETMCGTDQVTYPDHCVFAKASCQPSSTIKLDYEGACGTQPQDSHMTTIPPSTVTWGHDPGYDLIKDVFCDNINTIICGNHVDSDICATDGKVYTNQCLFAKVKCFKPDLEPTNPAKCHENGLPLKSTPKSVLIG
ncbi:follistatin-like [Haliotis rufescens]|uniref:follistatin-like n=1 Tax=Haliotis rufescens TaxID=6454 RepID=UPI00201EE285|nr:follistatin-like [Haliotis rufescens]